jgi:hypothetical protein
MRAMRRVLRTLGPPALCLLMLGVSAPAQRRARAQSVEEFGPNVRAYLGYLRNEQEVVDDRASRREIDHRYYLHNSNRILALRQMAVRLARESGNDYLPELEAVTEAEFEQLFEDPLPKAEELQQGGVLNYKLRYLGTVLSRGEKFFLFARLDPYEQVEMRKTGEAKPQAAGHTAPAATDAAVRPRRAGAP